MKSLRKALGKISEAGSGWRTQLIFGLCWALVVSAIVFLHFINLGWRANHPLAVITAIYFVGAAAGGALSVLISTAFARHRGDLGRFAFFFVTLCVLTLGFILLIFVFQHRIYFAQWHANFPSIVWVFQFFFTGLGSIHLFLVTGMRPLLPYGVIALIIASLCFSRGWLDSSR